MADVYSSHHQGRCPIKKKRLQVSELESFVYQRDADSLKCHYSSGKTGRGTVTSNPPAIDCGVLCSADFDSGTDVTLTAVPATGNIFTGWSGGGCTGRGNCTVTMNEQKEISAAFAKKFTWPMFLPAITKREK
jgi:hypothetical protein